MLERESLVFHEGNDVVFDEAYVKARNGATLYRSFDTSPTLLSNETTTIAGRMGNNVFVSDPNTGFPVEERTMSEIRDVILWGNQLAIVGKRSGDPDITAIYVWRYNPITGKLDHPVDPEANANNPLRITDVSFLDNTPAVFSIHDNFLLLGHGNRIYWASAGSATTWAQAPENSAGNIQENEFHTNITALKRGVIWNCCGLPTKVSAAIPSSV